MRVATRIQVAEGADSGAGALGPARPQYQPSAASLVWVPSAYWIGSAAYLLWPPDPIAPPAHLGTLLGFDDNPPLFGSPRS
jgi:hypothetical protein